jgi:hypothetical protein
MRTSAPSLHLLDTLQEEDGQENYDEPDTDYAESLHSFPRVVCRTLRVSCEGRGR